MSRHILLLTLLVILLTGLVLAGCGGSGAQTTSAQLAPESDLHPALRSQPAEVKEAYRFAIANKELLEQIPCFCGCNAVGHTSNYSCYVAADGGPGTVLKFDSHAVG